MENRYKVLAIGVALQSLCTTAVAATPNVVLVVVDDMGYNDLSFRKTALADVKKYGTPYLNSLAKGGVYFENAYSTCPVSSPARNGIITGCYQERWGNYTFNQGGLSPERVTIAEYLHDRGYATKKIGKVHLNGGPVEHPMDRGFDEFLGFINHSWDYIRLSNKDREAYYNKGALDKEVLRGDLALGALCRNRDVDGADYDDEDAFTTRIFTDEAVEFIERNSGKRPFFVSLSYNALHNPTYIMNREYAERVGVEYTPWNRDAEEWNFPYWDPSHERGNDFHKYHGNMGYVRSTGRKSYLSQLLAVDDSIGRLVESLKSSGEYENTIFIFVSDNGGEYAGYSNNDPLVGHKYMMGEGGIRVPLILSYPDGVKRAKVKQVVSAMDIFPTIVELTGGESTGLDLDGRSLLAREPQHEILVWDLGTTATKDEAYAVRCGDWKLANNTMEVRPGFDIDKNGMAIPAHKLEYNVGLSLYNLKEDPCEQNNVADKYPEIVDKLQGIHKSWRAEMPDPIKMPPQSEPRYFELPLN